MTATKTERRILALEQMVRDKKARPGGWTPLYTAQLRRQHEQGINRGSYACPGGCGRTIARSKPRCAECKPEPA
jgi:hypothetical protein